MIAGVQCEAYRAADGRPYFWSSRQERGDGSMSEVTDAAGSPTIISPVGHKSSPAGPTVPAANAPRKDLAVIEYAGERLESKTVRATEGVDGVEISTLLTTLGVVTLDPGFANTGSTTSAVTYINGEAGILRYRGYPIERL